MRLDKRLSDLEAKHGGGAPLLKSHLIGVGEYQTRDEAMDTYGRERIGDDDMVIFLVGMGSAADTESVYETAPCKDRSNEAR